MSMSSMPTLVNHSLSAIAADRRRPRRRARPPAARPGACPGLRVDALGHLAEVVAEGVVALPRLGVGQHVVGLGDLLEPLLGAGVLVDVGVVRAGQLPVRALDLVGRRVRGDAEHLVEVAPVGHQPALLGDHDAGRAQDLVAVAVAGADRRDDGPAAASAVDRATAS